MSQGNEPRWQARVVPARGLRRLTNRALAQADVIAPDGTRYLVRVRRNLPIRDSPMGVADNLIPQHISLAILVGANVYTWGRTGWSVQVLRPETPWRVERVIHTRRVRASGDVVEAALAMVATIRSGATPWDDDVPLTVRGVLGKLAGRDAD